MVDVSEGAGDNKEGALNSNYNSGATEGLLVCHDLHPRKAGLQDLRGVRGRGELLQALRPGPSALQVLGEAGRGGRGRYCLSIAVPGWVAGCLATGLSSG